MRLILSIKSIIIYLTFLYCPLVLAQGEANNWYFGANAGLDFNSGAPVALTDGLLYTTEGCATISNGNGNLLFYTDGRNVWDKTHSLMPNGTGLQGDDSSSQSGIIVPVPNDINKYYIFCVDDASDNGGLYYSVVDMTLNNGNGDIIIGQKNINLLNKSCEKIAAIESTDNGFWVLSYSGLSGIENSYDTIHAFKITDSGIQPSVTSQFPSIITADGRGYLKISPDATRISICHQNSTAVHVLDFDNVSGIASNLISLDTDYNVYCAEFSLSSNVIYVGTGGYTPSQCSLYQFDLTASNIQNSRVTIHTEYSERGALQLAVDSKIYYARPNKGFVGVINNPEAVGAACNYVNQGVDLNGKTCRQGLPPFIQSYFLVGLEANNTCFGDTTEFSINTNDTITSISWDFGDGNTSTEETPSHTYSTPGSYDVSVTVSSSTDTVTSTRTVIIYEVPNAYPIQDFYLCDDTSNDGFETFDLTSKDIEIMGPQSSSTFNVSYFNSVDDAENHINPLTSNYINQVNGEEIIAKIYNAGNTSCYTLTTFRVFVSLQPIANSVPNQTFCDDESNDGTELIDLVNSFNNLVYNGQSNTDYTISYHTSQSDADSGSNNLPANFQTINNPQDIFIRIENNYRPECYDTTSFTITIYNNITAHQPDDINLCDDISNDGAESFDLNALNTSIINGQSGNLGITYHLSEIDANTGTNPIQSPYQNTIPEEEIFVRLENLDYTNCYDVTSFFVRVLEKPIIEMDNLGYICTNETLILTADDGYDGYIWSTGETTQSIIITEAGQYTVTVIKDYPVTPSINCTSEQTIEIIESDEAIINSVENIDWTLQDNSITIDVSGIGDYEYSIDNLTYQDSNIFEGLETGEHTIYVRDKNGCGIVNKTTYLLFYPYFFTPNGDGFNDTWQIIASRTEPNLKIYIFDRYGKFLKQLDPSGPGWDGTFNGQQMPSTDYWFLVERPNKEKIYRGHFTLKR